MPNIVYHLSRSQEGSAIEPRFSVMTVSQAAKVLQVSDDHLYRLLKQGEIPGALKVGEAWRIYAPAIYQWLRGEWPQTGRGGDVGPAAEHITS